MCEFDRRKKLKPNYGRKLYYEMISLALNKLLNDRFLNYLL